MDEDKGKEDKDRYEYLSYEETRGLADMIMERIGEVNKEIHIVDIKRSPDVLRSIAVIEECFSNSERVKIDKDFNTLIKGRAALDIEFDHVHISNVEEFCEALDVANVLELTLFGDGVSLGVVYSGISNPFRREDD